MLSTPLEANRSGPFAGLLVIDLTHVLNGPFGTTLLADLGARVIKIEPPGHGDDTRTYGPFVNGQSLYFSFVNRGKESIVLNLKDAADKAILLEMVERADVLTESFRPGAMARLGLAYDDLAKLNPQLIYASSSGFGQTGPLAMYPAYDTIVQAMSGLMSMTGFPDGPPTRVGTSFADLCGGLFMFSGIASALYAREQTGRGAHVDIAMFDATLSFLEHGFMEFVATGQALSRIGNRHPFMTPFDIFHSADSDIAICCGNDKLFALLCDAIGKPGLINDGRFVSNISRTANHAALKRDLEAVLKAQPAAYWLAALHEAGVPVGPVFNMAEAIQHPQTKARNMLIEAGGVHMPGNPIKISSYPEPAARGAAPTLNQQGDALRHEFAATPNSSRTAAAAGAVGR